MYRQRSNLPTSPELSKPNLSPLRSVFRRLFVKMLSSGAGRSGGDATPNFQSSGRISDPLLPLLNLSALGRKMDTVRGFLSDAVDRRALVSPDQLRMVSSEITSAVQSIILNGAALLASSHTIAPMPPASGVSSTVPRGPPAAEYSSDRNLAPDKDATAEDDGDDCDIVDIDTADLLAEHVHFCEVCGKGFKRDANLRMHMRAHGNQFKTLEALSKPPVELEGGETAVGRKVRFSCPFAGCNRNRTHKKFRPLKAAVCVKNHFKRSHCPKTYLCHRCNKKSFSVVADLRSHLKHCGESHWRCSCGTSFSRKDKLFGHIALFEGHMPAVAMEENENRKDKILDKGNGIGGAEPENECFDADFFKGIVEKINEIESSDWVPH